MPQNYNYCLLLVKNYQVFFLSLAIEKKSKYLMEIIKTPILGLLVISPNVFGDERGHFFESWSKKAYQNIGLDLDFCTG